MSMTTSLSKLGSSVIIMSMTTNFATKCVMLFDGLNLSGWIVALRADYRQPLVKQVMEQVPKVIRGKKIGSMY